MKRLRLDGAAPDIDWVSPRLEEHEDLLAGPGQVVVQVQAAGVNPSDVKAAMGMMPHAVWPRTPGRDFAGTVVAGPADLVGRAVFGSSGELGIKRDGTHATHLVLPREAVVEKPDALSREEAGALGVPFVTAWEGLRRAGLPGREDVVLVLGANGKVGQAAVQIAAARGARVFGVMRGSAFEGHAAGPVRIIDASQEDVAKVVHAETGGHGATIAYNTVGSPYFAAANASLGIGGRQVLIATLDRAIPFDILAFYRKQLTYVGIDTLALTSVATADILRELLPGFASGALRPFPVHDSAIYELDRAVEAYRAVIGGAKDRVVLRP